MPVDALYRFVVEESTDYAIIALDSNGLIVIWNTGAERLLGYGRSEMIGRSPHRLFTPEDLARRIPERELETARADGCADDDRWHVCKDGTRVWVNGVLTPLRDDAGHFVGFSKILRDRTERKRADEELETSRSYLRVLTARILSIQEEERRRIAREIHDQLGQTLTALKLEVGRLERRRPENRAALKERVDGMLALIDSTIDQVQRIATELRPGALDDLGLVAAVEDYVAIFSRRAEIRCTLKITPTDLALDRDRSTAVFRILQEALTNVARHARATEARVTLEGRPDGVTLIVEDDGRGITPGEASGLRSFGLNGVRERARAWGGRVQVENVEGGGTRLVAEIPSRESGNRSPEGPSL